MLRPIGTLTYADADGFLPRLGAKPIGVWSDVADDIADQAEHRLKNRLIAVVLRGSTARHTAVEDSSDIDVLMIVKGTALQDHDIRSRLRPRLKVEATEMGLTSLAHDRRQTWMRFALAYSGCVVRGIDVLRDLPEPKLGPHAVAHLRRHQHWLDAAENDLLKATDHARRRDICQWVMKRCVRAIFESVMLEINAYSRDIYPCAKAASDAYPDHASLIWDAATLAVAPVSDVDHINRVLVEITPLLQLAAGRIPSAGPHSS